MTEPKAWHCPNCNAYHAPHVDTCPKPKAAAGSLSEQLRERDAFSLEEIQKRHAEQFYGQKAARNYADILGDQRIGVTVGSAGTKLT